MTKKKNTCAPKNPKKKSLKLVKAKLRLAHRQKDYDGKGLRRENGYTRPGSLKK